MKKILHQIRYSLALRLVLLSLATMLGVSLIFFASMGYALKTQFRNTLLPHILQYQSYIEKDIGTPPDLQKARQLANRLSIDLYISREGELNWSSTGKPFDDRNLAFQQYDDLPVLFARHRGHFFIRSLRDGYVTTMAFRHPQDGLPLPGKVLSLLALLSVLALSYLAIRRLFQPIETIRSGIRQIGAGELGYRIDVPRKDELGDLADSINGMAADIEAMLEAKRTMLLAISHELRSPITRSRVSVALLEDSTARDNIRRDLAEMETLVSELLESERLSQKHVVLDCTEEDSGKLISDVVESNFQNQGIKISLADEPVRISVDAVRIRLLLKNLLGNALRFNRSEKGAVEVRSCQSGDSWVVEVIDHGPGIAAEHIEHLTEAFYRADPSRQRKTGGYGLGLYLCKAIAEAHGGELKITSRLGEGTVVMLVLPCGRSS